MACGFNDLATGAATSSLARKLCNIPTVPRSLKVRMLFTRWGIASKELTVRGRTGTIAPDRTMRRGLLLLLGIGLPLLLHGQSTGRGSAIVLNHVAVIDVAQSVVRPDMAIVIRGARIVAIDRPNAPERPARRAGARSRRKVCDTRSGRHAQPSRLGCQHSWPPCGGSVGPHGARSTN